MTTKHIKITDGAKEELRRATINGDKLNFQGQLKNYAELKKLFIPLGITWHKGEKQHYIEGSTPQKIREILGGAQIVDEKKTLQFYPTPSNLAQRIVGLANIKGTDLVLESSCGRGAIVEQILKKTDNIFVVEINKEYFDYTTTKFNCVGENIDFLEFNSSVSFDKAVINPPFTANQDCKHVDKTFGLLKPGGRLVAIMGGNISRRQFQDLIKDKIHQIIEVEGGAFKESGTLVKTIILVLDKN